ncbi:MAG: hypothetical protein LBD41_07880 [Clostridiales Family XIII bacterium]|jgi:hypothetical protein|nr:hypothetical protein [Clostridiales Family XIII bacterium]
MIFSLLQIRKDKEDSKKGSRLLSCLQDFRYKEIEALRIQPAKEIKIKEEEMLALSYEEFIKRSRRKNSLLAYHICEKAKSCNYYFGILRKRYRLTILSLSPPPPAYFLVSKRKL